MIWPFRRSDTARGNAELLAERNVLLRALQAQHADLKHAEKRRDTAEALVSLLTDLREKDHAEIASVRAQAARDAITIRLLTEAIDDLQAAQSAAA
jgi:rubrerythrin